MENSGFLSSCDRDICVPIKFQWMSQASCHVEAWDSAFLSSCILGVRNPVEFRWETCFLLKCNRGVRLPLCSDAVFRVPLDMLHGNLALSGVDAYSVSFRLLPGTVGFLSRFSR